MAKRYQIEVVYLRYLGPSVTLKNVTWVYVTYNIQFDLGDCCERVCTLNGSWTVIKKQVQDFLKNKKIERLCLVHYFMSITINLYSSNTAHYLSNGYPFVFY